MTIELSKEQYVSLLKIAFLGEWMANSFREDRLPEYDDIDQHIMSFAKQTDLKDLVIYDKKLKRWFPTREMESDMHAYIDEYDEDYFAEELVYRLARRDVLKKYGDKFHEMSREENIRVEDPFLAKYYDELGKNGLQNIGIIMGK